MPTSLPSTLSSPVAIADGLHVLGGLIELDGRVSWAPPTARGLQPSNCYLLQEGGRALLVDSGLGAHEDVVVGGLAALIGEGSALTMFFTRAEMDCASNLEPIASRFEVEALFTGGVSNPFDAFDNLEAIRSRRHQLEQREARGDSMARTSSIEVAPGRALEIESPLMRLLPTFWGWDAKTGTLFTSDSFTHGTMPDASASRVIDSVDDVSLDEVSAFMFAKHWWLPVSTSEPIRDWMAARFEALDPEIVAPTRGCVLRGRDVVRRHLEVTLQALAISA